MFDAFFDDCLVHREIISGLGSQSPKRRFEDWFSTSLFNFGSQEIDVRGLQSYQPKSSSVIESVKRDSDRYTETRFVFRNSIPIIRDRSIVTELPRTHQTKVILIHLTAY